MDKAHSRLYWNIRILMINDLHNFNNKFLHLRGGLKQLSLLPIPARTMQLDYAITRIQGEQTQKCYLQEDIFIYENNLTRNTEL